MIPKTNLNWFPGHMSKATNDIKELLPNIDIIIEVLDARIPYSSQNPVIAEFSGKIPLIKLLNKDDLADPEITKQWMAYFEKDPTVRTLAINSSQHLRVQALVDLCHQLVPRTASQVKSIKAMIVGVPNVGKSTLINTIKGRKITVTGNEPAVTKAQQRIKLDEDIVLFDTPGILWPKFHNQNSAYRLAVTGAIKNTAVTFDDIACYAMDYLIQAYPERVKERYGLEELPKDAMDFFEIVGVKKRYFSSGKYVDYIRLGEMVIHDIRKPTLGRLSFETPEMAELEEVLAQQAKIDREIRKEAQMAGKKKRRPALPPSKK
jgi:ribosome biogenesis GTPase A